MIVSVVFFVVVIFLVINPIRVPMPRLVHDTYLGDHIMLDFGVAPLLAVVILLAAQVMEIGDVTRGIVGDENLQPYGIIILFFSLSYLCLSLDQTGIFGWAALQATIWADNSGLKIWFAFAMLSTVITLITSNDIVILTLTPIIVYFCQYTVTDPIPYLFVEFFSANVWSISLYIGNPTNIIMANAEDIGFLSYSKWMALPAISAGVTLLITLYFVFRHRIPHTVNSPDVDPVSALKDPNGAVFGSIWLLLCLIGLATCDYFYTPLWAITLGFGSVMLVRDVITDVKRVVPRSAPNAARAALKSVDAEAGRTPRKPKAKGPMSTEGLLSESDIDSPTLLPPSMQPAAVSVQGLPLIDDDGEDVPKTLEGKTPFEKVQLGQTGYVVAHMPWRVLPFVIGMFILVEHLETVGTVGELAKALSAVVEDSDPFVVSVWMTLTSVLGANILNNQPMTILFSKIVGDDAFNVTGKAHDAAVFAVIIGSNIGANLTPIGALAGLMWRAILEEKGIKITTARFVKYGAMCLPPMIIMSSLVLAAELAYFPR
eukprot:TRINITY_DN5079_c0_g1_i1.p1 TRINITY_DN5079_c0_g1~~TRINITY_DN5079_c0_g1_i1.p1  ORF type:complete len:543 (+),score=118.74 TRINITY_DN5079_c0_g1_i1:3-1631(+)